MVSSLTCRSLIHFEFIFIFDVGKCSNFILLHIAYYIYHIYPALFIEEIFLSPWYSLASFVIDLLTIGV